MSGFKHGGQVIIPDYLEFNDNSVFDVTMGSYNGAEICELVGLFILNNLGQKIGRENIGLYRDDGLAIMKNKSARLIGI